MVVTEFALIELKPDTDNAEFENLVRESIEVQDRWVRENQPRLLQDKPYKNLSTFFLERKPDSLTLLITAPWDSPEGHQAWIQSEDNQVIFGKLGEHLTDESGSAIVYHMDPAGEESELRGDLFAQEAPFKLCKLSVNPSQQEEVQEKYWALEAQAKEANPSSRVWAGWRIEKDDDARDLNIFWNHDVLDGLLDDLLSTPDSEHEILQFANVE
ncbi:hypothetical protein B0T10DRAFT_559075 [Thelonectria olida]|uniref:Uncharacterized protein n=1 Tax=Thelonectria olida TaxID=1576542 RepID=A0A9P8W8B7_9HYPO|nr:hypothetical protein B0T10DRAFT_559075 [Thelonectria olida]